MKAFCEVINKVLVILGFDIFGRYRHKISFLMSAIKYFNLSILTIGLVLIWLYILDQDPSANTIIQLLNALHGTICGIRFLTICFNGTEIGKFITSLRKTYDENFGSKPKTKFLRLLPRFSIPIFFVNVALIIINNGIQIVRMFICYLTGIKITDAFAVKFWWTFDPYDHILPVFTFQLYVHVLWQLTAGIMDGLVVFSVSLLTECFHKLGEEIKEVIDGDFEDKKERLKKLIDIHCELIDFHKRLESLFGIAIFVVFFVSSLAICILGFMAVYVKFLYKFKIYNLIKTSPRMMIQEK